MNLRTKNAIDYLTTSYGKKIPILNAVSDLLGKALSTPEKIYRALKYPKVREYYTKMSLAAVKDDLPNMVKYAKLTNNSLNQMEKKEPESKYREIQ